MGGKGALEKSVASEGFHANESGDSGVERALRRRR